MHAARPRAQAGFYDNLISSGTKMWNLYKAVRQLFYDNLISSGTKILLPTHSGGLLFYDNLISSGTKILAAIVPRF